MHQKVRNPTGIRTLVPACMAAVAYIDPGNFGVNVESGASYGYALAWVVVAASLVGMVVQYLAAKLGAATGLSLAENCRERCSSPVRVQLWLVTELVVIMTDLAELVGGAFALNILFGVPLLVGAAIVGAVSFVVLAIRVRGHEGFEVLVLALLAIVVVAVLWQTMIAGVDLDRLATEIAPGPMEPSAALLAAGIVGATVMPHALHFQSAVCRPVPVVTAAGAHGKGVGRDGGSASIARDLRRSVVIAMSVVGLANVAIVLAAAVLPKWASGDLAAAYTAFGDVAGRGAAVLFGLSLLASGLASTVVGAYTGQVVMQGFLRRSYTVWVRRLVSLAPPLVLLALGLNATQALVLSQVVLSFAAPTSLIPLVVFTRRRAVMGELVNRRFTTWVASAATALIIALNVYVLLALV